MDKFDLIKIKVENLREILKFLLLLLMGILTAETTLIYKILNNKCKLFMIIFVFVGIVLMFLTIQGIKLVWEIMNKDLKDFNE